MSSKSTIEAELARRRDRITALEAEVKRLSCLCCAGSARLTHRLRVVTPSPLRPEREGRELSGRLAGLFPGTLVGPKPLVVHSRRPGWTGFDSPTGTMVDSANDLVGSGTLPLPLHPRPSGVNSAAGSFCRRARALAGVQFPSQEINSSSGMPASTNACRSSG